MLLDFNDAVRSAVGNTDAKYVLMLDRNGFVRDGDTLWSMDGVMNESDWRVPGCWWCRDLRRAVRLGARPWLARSQRRTAAVPGSWTNAPRGG